LIVNDCFNCNQIFPLGEGAMGTGLREGEGAMAIGLHEGEGDMCTQWASICVKMMVRRSR
jgi:hypothetical protein